MRKKIITIFFALIPLISLSQNNYFFNEIGIWPNKCITSGDNSEGEFGFGLEVYKYLKKDAVLEVAFGVGYNMLNQIKSKIEESSTKYYSDLNYTLQSTTFPLVIRINPEAKRMFFITGGVSANFLLTLTESGTEHILNSNTNQYETKEFSLTKNQYELGYGYFLGIGYTIDLQAVKVRISPQYVIDKTTVTERNERLYTNYFRLYFGIFMLQK